MYQQEIKFFWPLTEQIQLDLDFTPCEDFEKEKHNLATANTIQLFTCSSSGEIAWPTITGALTGLEISSGTITIRNFEMPWYRKALFKLIGFKWN